MKAILNKLLLNGTLIIPLILCISCISFVENDPDFLTRDDEIFGSAFWHTGQEFLFVNRVSGDIDTVFIDKTYFRQSFKLVEKGSDLSNNDAFRKGEMYIKFRILHNGNVYNGLLKKTGGGKLKDKLECYIDGKQFSRMTTSITKLNYDGTTSEEDALKFVDNNNNSTGLDYLITGYYVGLYIYSINDEQYQSDPDIN